MLHVKDVLKLCVVLQFVHVNLLEKRLRLKTVSAVCVFVKELCLLAVNENVRTDDVCLHVVPCVICLICLFVCLFVWLFV